MMEETQQQKNEVVAALAFQAALESEVLKGLNRAIENAVAAQQQLYEVGQAALSLALKKRLDAQETEGAEGAASPGVSLQDVAERLQGLAEATKGGSKGKAPLLEPPAQVTSRLMTAFAVALAMLNEVNVQHMLGNLLVVVASDVRVRELDAGDARILLELLTGNRLAELLAELKAAQEAMGG